MTLIDLECPSGHLFSKPFTEEQLHEISLGRFELTCTKCGAHWEPTAKQQRNIANRLQEGSLP